jgi:hypothetical protein
MEGSVDAMLSSSGEIAGALSGVGTGSSVGRNSAAKKIENTIPSGSIEWKTENGKIKLSTNGTDWIDYKNNKPEAVAQLRKQFDSASSPTIVPDSAGNGAGSGDGSDIGDGSDSGIGAGADTGVGAGSDTYPPIPPARTLDASNPSSSPPPPPPNVKNGGKKSKKRKSIKNRKTRNNRK